MLIQSLENVLLLVLSTRPFNSSKMMPTRLVYLNAILIFSQILLPSTAHLLARIITILITQLAFVLVYVLPPLLSSDRTPLTLVWRIVSMSVNSGS